MKSATPKVLHAIGGRSLLGHALAAARERSTPSTSSSSSGTSATQVAAHLPEIDAGAIVADQDEVPGTGRAVQCGLDALAARARRRDAPAAPSSSRYGDVPLLTGQTLAALVAAHEDGRRARSPCSPPSSTTRPATAASSATRDGDVAGDRRAQGRRRRAARDPRDQLRHLRVRRRACCVDALGQVGTRQRAGRGVPDRRRSARPRRRAARCARCRIDDVWQIEGVNDRVQLATLGAELNRRIARRAGCAPASPSSTRRPPGSTSTCASSRDVTLLPGVQLRGGTTVARRRHRRPRHHADATARSARAPRSCARHGARRADRRRRHRRPVHATCGRAPCSARDGKIGAFVEIKNARDRRRARRCRTCPTSATPTIGDGHEHRRRDGVRQLRRRRQAPHDGRRPRAGSAATHARRAGHRRRRRLHRGRLGDHPGRPARRDGGRRAARQRNVEGWVRAAPARARRPPRPPRQARRARDETQTTAATARRPTTARTGEQRMTGITTTSEKRLMLITGRAHPELAERGRGGARRRAGPDDGATTSPTARSTSASTSACAAATRSSCRATARRSTSGSWSSCSWSTRSSAPRPSASR